MNAKKAKAARKAARAIMPVGTVWERHLKHNVTGSIIVDPRCGKGIYRNLKKQARRA